MGKKASYEYDRTREVLIRIPEIDLSDEEIDALSDEEFEAYGNKIMYRSELRWRPLSEEQDNSYLRAIYLGQGCWDRLDCISEEEAQQVLQEWGYSEED